MLNNECDPWSTHRRFRRLGSWFLQMLQFEKPVVVGVNGYAVGGGIGLALTGDLVIAAESAKLVAGFFRLGVIPDIGMMYTLPRLIGLARAKRFLFGDETLSASEAFDLGMVARVVPDHQLDLECLQQAKQFAAGPSHVMGLAKLLMSRSFETGFNEMFMLEDLGQALAMSSDEFHEGLSAMLDRRPADFVAAGKANPTTRRRRKTDKQ
jgi:2-(1,2-epoxy-1,2-dihydrophenyl)acetyl-CoA isomerase